MQSDAISILKALRKLGELHVVTDEVDFRAPGTKPHSYEVWAFPRWMLSEIDKVLADEVLDADYSGEPTVAVYEEVLKDKRRLTRELDVALNGERGAAKQASLCDLIGDAQRIRAALTTATGAVDKLSRHGLLTQIKLDRVNIENDSLRAALEGVMIGGNHLAVHGGPGYKVEPDVALEYFGAGPKYDAWVCWSTIMRAGDTLNAFKKLKQTGET